LQNSIETARRDERQGTTLVVPEEQQITLGFSPAVSFSAICNSAAAKAGFQIGHLWHD